MKSQGGTEVDCSVAPLCFKYSTESNPIHRRRNNIIIENILFAAQTIEFFILFFKTFLSHFNKAIMIYSFESNTIGVGVGTESTLISCMR